MLTLEYLARLLESNREAASARVAEFAIGHQHFAFNSRPALMGGDQLIAGLLVSRERLHQPRSRDPPRQSLARTRRRHHRHRAESTLAHAARADETTQKDKLIPLIRQLRAQNILVSAETYHLNVARACLETGANVLNLTGTQSNDELFRLVADHDAAVIICYVQGENVREVGDFDFGADAVERMKEYFARQIETASRHKVEKILIDPGLGFYYRNLQDSAVRVQHQIKVFLNTFRLRTLGFPVCHALPHAF